MTREQAWRIVRAYYEGQTVDGELLPLALRKLNYRREGKARLHPLPADVRTRVNLALMFNLGKAIGRHELEGTK